MTDLRKAAEQALKALDEYCITRIITKPISRYWELRDALAEPETFKPDWDMIQPFHERIKELEIENERLRQALQRPVKSYTNGEPQYATEDMSTKQQNVNTSEERVHEIDKSIHEKTHTDHPMRHWDRTCPACVAEQEADEWYEKALWGEKQEPVAWVEHEWGGSGLRHLHFDRRKPTLRDEVLNPVWTPLYTAPPSKPWVSLSEEEIEEIQYSTDTQVEYELFDEGEYGTEINIYPEKFARAIEAKLKEKNT